MPEIAEPVTPDVLCGKLAMWADVAKIGVLVTKSDLLARLIYGGEKGPSQTPCPVHKGVWSGIHFGWPGDMLRRLADGVETPMDVEPRLQEWRDAGCRCSTHVGSNGTTGWNPDTNCCLPAGSPR